MSVLEGFMSTWSKARQTFGEGTPQSGEQYDKSGAFTTMQTTVQSAAPGSKWTGKAADAYGTAITDHGEVFGKLAGLDQRLSAQITQSSQVVDAGRRNLDSVRDWVVSAASSVPDGKNREQMLMPIVSKGLGQVSDIITTSDGDLGKIGGTIQGIGTEYDALKDQKFGKGGAQGVTGVQQGGPLDQGQPADPRDPFVGDDRFGQWETVPLPPTGPYAPLNPEYRPYSEDTPLKTGPTTGLYVPGQTWVADEDAPIVQGKEGYRFRIAGTEATTTTRVVDVNGQPQLQRWVANVYEYQRNTSYVPGGDLGGLPPVQTIDQNWKPISLPQIATLSANNMLTTYYLPDGCGGTVNFNGGVPDFTGTPTPPIMTRPR